jgi:hypothetical protein
VLREAGVGVSPFLVGCHPSVGVGAFAVVAVGAATLFNGIWSLLNEAWGDLHGEGCNSFMLIYSNQKSPLHLQRIFDR